MDYLTAGVSHDVAARGELTERLAAFVARNMDDIIALLEGLAELAPTGSTASEDGAGSPPRDDAHRREPPDMRVEALPPITLPRTLIESTIPAMVKLEIDTSQQTGEYRYKLTAGGRNIETANEASVIKCLNTARRTADKWLEDNSSPKRVSRWKPVELTDTEHTLRFQGELD